jgi:lipopolysaccharide transport system ATP-binding protein
MLFSEGLEGISPMSSDVVIKVEHVSKSFKVMGRGITHGPSEDARYQRDHSKGRFQALRDVSFEVKRGETVGIVGRNGAGKSTLLRIVCGMMQADEGSVFVEGNAYSVMGMGIGFDNNMTGRENIHIKGAVMGASSRDINKRFDWVVDFAEVGDYIDQPLRTYSKGMLSRLAFAITFAFDPKILVVDEALSGGDGAFKRKAEARLNEINDSGATVLIVSHGPSHHRNLCDRSILLDRGEIISEGPPEPILGFYNQLLDAGPGEIAGVIAGIRSFDLSSSTGDSAENASEQGASQDDPVVLPPDDFLDPKLVSNSYSESKPLGAQVIDIKLAKHKTLEPVNSYLAGSNIKFSATVKFKKKMSDTTVDLIVKSEDGQELFKARRPKPNIGRSEFRRGEEQEFKFTLVNRLVSGTYFIDIVVRGDSGSGRTVQHRVSDAAVFRSYSKTEDGLVDLNP